MRRFPCKLTFSILLKNCRNDVNVHDKQQIVNYQKRKYLLQKLINAMNVYFPTYPYNITEADDFENI